MSDHPQQMSPEEWFTTALTLIFHKVVEHGVVSAAVLRDAAICGPMTGEIYDTFIAGMKRTGIISQVGDMLFVVTVRGNTGETGE